MNRREFIRHLGIGIAAGAAVPFIPSLIPSVFAKPEPEDHFEYAPITASELSELFKKYYGPYLKEEFLKRDYCLIPKSVFNGGPIPLHFR